jgi:co-chaperonin GroES (HSP10)
MFKPLHSLVTVVLDPKVEKTKGGIDLPETMTASYRTGIVRAVGPGRMLECGICDRPFVTEGDRVVIGTAKGRSGNIENFGMITDDDGVDVALVNIMDIWGRLEPAPTTLVN